MEKGRILRFFLFQFVGNDIYAHSGPADRQRAEQKFAFRGQGTEAALTGGGLNLVQTVQSADLVIKLLHILRSEFLLPADTLVHILDQLTGGISKGGRAVENRGNEGVAGVLQQQICSINLDGI